MAKRSGDLDTYNKKRDPARTNEPFAPEPLSALKGKTMGGAFVVHLHDATRTHYDVRLEIGGSLKSFAVPRGPSLDPVDKRMAIHTEDHPLEYLDFEAVIPDGNYGAGPMIVWDRGTVQYLEGSAEEGIARNKIDFALYGYKLRGRFGLIKTSGRKGPEKAGAQEQWLLVKKTDIYAKSDFDITEREPWSVLSGMRIDELPRASELAAEVEAAAADAGAKRITDKARAQLDAKSMTPMLCTTSGAELNQRGLIYELKLDGVRILGERRGEDATLWYRTGRSASASYPEITRAMRALAPNRLLLDGEIVAFDEHGRPNFQKLGTRIQATRAYDVKQAMRNTPVVYLVFDLLAIGDHDLRALPLLERKRILAQLIRGKGLIRLLDHLVDDGRPLYELCRTQGLEGVVAKRADSTYQPGPTRSGDWVKLKLERTDDFVVFGITRGEGARDGLGALDLASYDGDVLRVRGRVGSGLDEASIKLLKQRLSELKVEQNMAVGEMLPAPKGQTFVKPEIVVSVRYSNWTEEGRLRHPVFVGVREDLHPRDCVTAPDEDIEAREIAAADEKSRAPLTASSLSRVTLSNQDKIFWPDEGYTKGDLCNYYLSVAPFLLPYLKDRPVLMVRYPDGIEGKSFYQWNVPQGVPDWVHTFPIRSEEENGRDVISFRVEDEETLLYIANLGCIPLHVLASRFSRLDTLDFLTIDFDIGQSPFRLAIELARSLHTLLDELGLTGFPKTSGQSGLHVLVPLGGVPYTTAKMLAELLGRLLNIKHPDISTMERMRDKRPPNVVYIDTGQTGRARSIVCPLSVRAYRGATVSTPLTWDEVGFALDPRHFTMFTVPERLERYGDPMVAMLDTKPDVVAVIDKLSKRLR